MAEDIPQTSVNLLSIPEEIIYGYVFPYLRKNDLLRFRRTCLYIKWICDSYIQSHWKIDREIEIDEVGCTFDHFLSMGFPFRRICLKNINRQFFEHPSIPEFLEQFGSEITHLRMENLFASISKRENNFYLALTNLQHLEVGCIDTFDARGFTEEDSDSEEVASEEKNSREPGYFPITFKNLKTLKLGDLILSDEDLSYAWDLMKFCTELEYFRHPRDHDFFPRQSDCCGVDPFDEIELFFEENLDLEKPDEPLKLKFYDIGFVTDDSCDGFSFASVVEQCYDLNVKLLNVNSNLFEQVMDMIEDREKFADPIISVINVHRNMFLTELPNLRQVIISSTEVSSFDLLYHEEDHFDDHHFLEWPVLEVLDITIDSEYTGHPVITSALIHFLFGYVMRPFLSDLRVRFNDKFLLSALPIPRAANIIENCPNVTNLTLTNWLGTNKAVSKLWGGLVHLREVTLEGCKLLGNVAFVGTDKDDPVFLKLKELKKLKLGDLDAMPKLTDLIFDLVFRHLQIEQFHLSSNKPVKSITAAGIRSLLTGNFNKCVEKFPFIGWSLDNVSEEEFKQLKSEFRASNML